MLNKDIMMMYQELINVSQDTEVKYPARVAFAVARNLKVLEPIAQDIQETRERIGAEFGYLVDGAYQIPQEKMSECNKELESLGELDVDVPLVKIHIEDLDATNLSIPQAQAMSFMLEEES